MCARRAALGSLPRTASANRLKSESLPDLAVLSKDYMIVPVEQTGEIQSGDDCGGGKNREYAELPSTSWRHDMSSSEETETKWLAVIGRCLAYLCLKNSKYAAKSLLEQSEFLEKLGLPFEDRAGVTGSTTASLYELARRTKARKRARKNGKKTRG
jgi:hypothetical protein